MFYDGPRFGGPFHDGGFGWWALPGILLMVALAVLVVVAVVYLARGRGPGWRVPRPSSAEELLHERFARGEIDVDDYRSRLATLREQRSLGEKRS